MKRRIMNIRVMWIAWLFPLFLAVWGLEPAAAQNKIRPPQGVAPIFYVMHGGNYPPTEGAGALGNWMWAAWKLIEPQPGQYNWGIFDSYLAAEGSKNTRLLNGQVLRKPIAISIQILTDVRQNDVPDYIYKEITKSGDPEKWLESFPAFPKLDGRVCKIEDACQSANQCGPVLRPPWEHPYFQERFRALVKAFGARYDQDPRVNSIWITTGLYGENVIAGLGGCANAKGGKCPASDPCCYQNQCRFDFSPANVFGNWLIQKDILGTYRAAFPTKPLFIINSAPTARHELALRALQLSPPLGIKHNALEFDLPDQNTSDNAQWRSINLYWNEAQARGLEGMVGFEHFYYHAPANTYWALLAGLSRGMTLIDLPKAHLDVIAQMQREHDRAAISRDNSGDYFPMWRFVEDHFARKAATTPSVWIVLRDTAYPTGEPGDWEFYLYRPENLGGQAIPQDRPQAKTKSVGMGSLPRGAQDQFIRRSGAFVRRTDQANQNFYMYFKVDPRWPAVQTVGFDLEITYLDTGTDTFAVHYGPGGQREVVIQKKNTNKFIREKLSLPDLNLRDSINGTGDQFRIDCRGDGDEYIHMVRLIPKNWQAPLWDFGAPPPEDKSTPPSAPTGFQVAWSDSPGTPNPSPPPPAGGDVKIWLEAESARRLEAPMEISSDPNASGGKFIWVKEGGQSISSASQAGGYAQFSFEVPVAGQYLIWGRVAAKDWNADSFYVAIDNGSFVLWDIPFGGGWEWVPVKNRTSPYAITFDLTKGAHTLTIKQREAGAKLDRILITNDFEFAP